MYCGKTGNFRKECTAEKLEIPDRMYCGKFGIPKPNVLGKKLDITGRNVLRKNWKFQEGMYCGKTGHPRTECTAEKTGHSRKECTAEKLEFPDRMYWEKIGIPEPNVLGKNWTLPEGIYCGKTGHSRTECTAKKNWAFPEGMYCGKTGIPGQNVLEKNWNSRTECTGKKLDITGRNVLRKKLDTGGQTELPKTRTLADRLNCGKSGQCRTDNCDVSLFRRRTGIAVQHEATSADLHWRLCNDAAYWSVRSVGLQSGEGASYLQMELHWLQLLP
jgi:hypothetical protein